MDLLNEVIGAVVADTPPARDIDHDATRMHKLPISGTHAFTDANKEGGNDDQIAPARTMGAQQNE
jgi:hypothetical protein